MPTATRTFRIFVSSTFEDLKAERDALQRDVFPRLRKLCEENGARFQAIDLRWGVRDEAALDQQTMEICLREIERCQQTGIKPNFIVLLGERYGWRPLPARIEAVEFERVCERATDADKRLIEEWYERDENAVPPEYLLKPRTGEFVDKDCWGEVEQKLHSILREAARGAGLAQESLIKYEASATRQEILKGLGLSEEDRRHVFAFFREAAKGTEDDEELAALKDELSHKLPEGNIRPFQIGEIEKLCTDVEESLKNVILDEAGRFTSRDALDFEIEAHDRFAADRCRIFVGRTDALTAISDYVNGPERRPLVLHGGSGSGKSAVMAMASEQYKGPGHLIRRFIGASPESASGHALLASLCKQIVPGETPVDHHQLERAFQERLATATAEDPLVLFVDALDQLSASDPARAAAWLPAELPAHVKVIVSTTDDGERLPQGLPVPLERMSLPEGRQALDELLRGDCPKQAPRTLQPWQRDYVLAHFERCGLPLYLKLAADESRLWKSFSPPDVCRLGEGIVGVIDTLFDRLASNANHGPVLVERSLGYLAAARYGLTEDEMLDVLASDGAVWSDFDQRKHHEVSERRLPVVVWSRFSLDMEPYLTERAAPGGTVIAFYHRQLAERVEAKSLAGDETLARYSDLARYFSQEPAWLDEGHKTPNARRAAELVFQQRSARQWEEAEATLFDCPFLFAKVAAGMVLDLDDDYRALLRDARQNELRNSEALRLLQGTLQLSMHVVAKNPGQFASQMRGRLLAHQAKPGIAALLRRVTSGIVLPMIDCSLQLLNQLAAKVPIQFVLHMRERLLVHRSRPGISAFLENLDASTPYPRLRPLWPVLEPAGGAMLRVLVGHTGQITAVALSADRKRAVSGSEDKTVRVWDLEGNQPPRVLEGHTDWVRAVALSADGNHAISGSDDMTVRVWDLHGNQPPRILEGHWQRVNAVAVSGNGARAISGSGSAFSLSGDSYSFSNSGDFTIRVWDLLSDRSPCLLEGHTWAINAVVLSGDGKRAVSGSWDGTLRVWNLEDNRSQHILRGDARSVSAVAVSGDGSRVISGSGKTVWVWDLHADQPPQPLEGHTNDVKSVALSNNGKRAISGSLDNTVRVWDLQGKHPPRVLRGHSDRVYAVALSGDGKCAISGSGDRTLRVWDLRGNQRLTIPNCHAASVNAVALSADGKRAVSGSDDHTLRIWDLEGTRMPRILGGRKYYSVKALALSADGKRAVSCSDQDVVRVWDLEGNQPPCLLEGHSGSVEAVALSGDGRLAVSCSQDKTLRVWDLGGDRSSRVLEGHTSWVTAVAISGDGMRVISGSRDETLRVWDLEGNQPPRVLEGHMNWVRAVALSADGNRAVSAGSFANILRIWDLEANDVPRLLEGHTSSVNALALSDDGKHVVSGSWDETVRVWAIKTGKCLAVFTCDAPIISCAWARGRIAAGDTSGQVHLFAWEE